MNPIPKHVAIIMDGNRRWAKQRRLPTLFGHKKGSDNLEVIGEAALKKGVKVLTVWAFSTENWKRTKREVKYLMKILKTIKDKVPMFMKMNVRVVYSGRVDRFSKELQEVLKEVEEKTKNNKRGILNIALNYGGHLEIVDAFKRMVKDKVNTKRLVPATVENYLYRSDLPMPDLIIRTGGEQRLSGFMSWQAEYAELYFSKKLWPDFQPRDLYAAINTYCKRDRRFGGN